MAEQLLQLEIVSIKPELVQKQVECGKLFRDIMGMMSIQCGLCPHEFEYIAEFAMHLADDHPIPDVANPPNFPKPQVPEDMAAYVIEPDYESQQQTLANTTADIAEQNGDNIVETIFVSSNLTSKSKRNKSRSTNVKDVKFERCPLCKKRMSASKLEKHIEKLGPTIPPSQLKCHEPKCYRVYKAKCLLLKHIYRSHSDDSKKHKCHLCEKRYQTADALSIHIRVHEGVKPYECDECGKCFSSRQCIRGHLSRMHSGVKPYQCWHCGRRFNNSSFLKWHITMNHSPGNAKTFQCDKCEKAFYTVFALKGHYRTHTGERPFKCKYCDKSYSLHYTLKNHVQGSHVNARTFKCSHCPKTFNIKSTVRQHEKQVHERRMNLEKAKLADMTPY